MTPRPHGLLPAWGTAALPAPPEFTLRNVLRTVGPGVIGLGVAIGSGEWLLGPSVLLRYGPTLLWITTVSVILQVFLNLEMARYTLYTGEPVITGYMRTWPGPGFWGWTYGLLSFLQYGWPGWALASATASTALLLGRLPGAEDAGLVITLGYVTFGICIVAVSAGRRIERNIEVLMFFMMAWVGVFLLAVDVLTVSGRNWAVLARGLVSFGSLPAGADWVLLGAFAAYSGMGGVGNALVTSWMRDKGFGMGGTVGYIPAAMGTAVPLAPQGNVFTVEPSSLRAWSGWWKYVNVDQWGIFGLGSVAGMFLTTLMTLQHVAPGTEVGGWAVASLQAEALSGYGPLLWQLALLAGFWVLFSTQLGFVEGLSRAITDMLWTGSARVRRWRRGDVRGVYYSVLLAFAAWGCVALNLAQPLTLIVIGANMAAFNFVVVSLHTLVVNRLFLPAELRPSRWREAALVGSALFYGAFVAAAAWAWLRG